MGMALPTFQQVKLLELYVSLLLVHISWFSFFKWPFSHRWLPWTKCQSYLICIPHPVSNHFRSHFKVDHSFVDGVACFGLCLFDLFIKCESVILPSRSLAPPNLFVFVCV